jgi:hypothetical protein
MASYIVREEGAFADLGRALTRLKEERREKRVRLQDFEDEDVETELTGTWLDPEIRGCKLLKWSGLDVTEKNAGLAATQNQ